MKFLIMPVDIYKMMNANACSNDCGSQCIADCLTLSFRR